MHLACWERRRGGAFKIGTGTDVIWGSTIVLCQRNIQIWFNKTFFVLLTDPSLRCTAGLFSCRPTSLTRLFRTRKNQPSYITSRMKIHRDLAPIEFPFSFFLKRWQQLFQRLQSMTCRVLPTLQLFALGSPSVTEVTEVPCKATVALLAFLKAEMTSWN